MSQLETIVETKDEDTARDTHSKRQFNSTFESVIPFVLAVCTVAVYLYMAWSRFNYVQDDAFIPMRYAHNFWHGTGWVLNSNGDRVEGYTSPAHLWLVTILMRFLSLDGTIFALKFIGIGLGIVILWQTGQMTAVVFPGKRWLPFITPLVVVLQPGFTLSMLNALETGLATCLLTYGLVAFVDESRGDTSQIPVRSLLAFLGAAVTRPEYIVFYPILLLIDRRNRRGLYSLLVYAAVLGCLEAFRYIYYGDFLPNTFYAKWGAPTSLGDGWQYLLTYAAPAQSLFGMPLLAFGFAALLRRGTLARPFIVVAVLQFAFVLSYGKDWMQEGRFITPVLPELSLAVVAAGVVVSNWVLRGNVLAVEKLVFLAAGLSVLIGLDAVPRWDGMSSIVGTKNLAETLPAQPPLMRWSSGGPGGRRDMAQWVAQHAKPGQLVMTSELGIVSLLNPDVNFLDFRGLADKRIARMKSYTHSPYGVQINDWMNPNAEAADYILSRKPDLVIILDDGDTNDARYPAQSIYRPAGALDIRLDHADEGAFTVDMWRLNR